MSEQTIERIFKAGGWFLLAFFLLLVISGFYALTDLPYADLIRQGWL